MLTSNKNPGTRIICEWCGKLIIGRRKRFCDRGCQNRYLANNKSEETRKKTSESHKGKIMPESTRRKIGEKQRGKYVSESTRQKLRDKATGRVMSEDARRKMSESHRGRVVSEESKAKARETNLRTYNNYQYDASRPQPEYRRKAIEAYGYQCSGCGKCEGVLQVHHLDGNHDNDDLENLVVLCISCHNKIHNKRKGDYLNEEFTKEVISNRNAKGSGK